jgi:5-methylcytosine-specific restriction enzyme subunit McrC
MIKIQNIYYMLAYAFRVLNEDGYANIATEEFEHIGDLCAAILAKGIANQIKRGLGKKYICQTNALCSPCGKINVSA